MKKKHHVVKKMVSGIVILIFIAGIAAGVIFLLRTINSHEEKLDDISNVEPEPEPEPEPKNPELIDLQKTVDAWVKTQKNARNSGIIIYDIDNDEVVAKHNENQKFRIESIYKMFVALEGYYRIDSGKWKGDDTYRIAKDFNNKTYTRYLCLDHMIRYSYSICAEVMWNEIGHGNLQTIYNNKGYKNTSIQGLTSTPSDLMKLYQEYWEHEDLSEDSWKKIKDSMLNQKANTKNTTYNRNWRQGLPSGFSTAKVYNKVGWLGDGRGNWTYYDDAAFLVFPEKAENKDGEKVLERHYIMIALTNYTSPKQLVELGKRVESAVKTADKY